MNGSAIRVWGLYGLLIVGVVIAVAMVLFSVAAVTHSSKHTNPREKMHYERTRAKGNLVLLASMHWITVYFCYLSVCRALAPDLVGYRFYILMGGLVVLSPIFIGVYFAVRPRSPARTDAEKLETSRTGDLAAQWKWGLFYWNPNDPSVIVEHRYGMGVTLNLARPVSWVLISVLVLLVAGSIAFIVMAG